MTSQGGIPLAVIVSGANEHDVNFILPLVFLKLPRVGGKPGRPRQFPRHVRADQGYTSSDLLDILDRCGIEAQIPQQGKPQPKGLGRFRWPVERTLAWLKQYRRVGTRRDRNLSVYSSFVTLACAMITYKQLAF